MSTQQQQQQPQGAFGVLDHVQCPKCGNRMWLSRRTPDSVNGDDYERQRFECRSCDHELERSVDTQGRPPPR